MGVIKKIVVIKEPDQSELSSEEDGRTDLISVPRPFSDSEASTDEGVPAVRTTPRPPPSPYTPRKKPKTGHKLVLKKGRRSRHRYENERKLFGAGEVEDEDDVDGWDIIEDKYSKSAFASLVENGDLLDAFVNNRENYEEVRRYSKADDRVSDEFNPERAFMNIGQGLRTAFKKHLPWGMLESLEEEIRNFFLANPHSEFVSADFSSFERLLAHACSTYNHLKSKSFDDDGKRKLKIENPSSDFRLLDPSLSNYLKTRSGGTA